MIDIDVVEIFNSTLSENKILNKSKTSFGGGVYFEGSRNLNIKKSIFERNFAYFKGGAIFILNSFNTTIIQSSFK